MHSRFNLRNRRCASDRFRHVACSVLTIALLTAGGTAAQAQIRLPREGGIPVGRFLFYPSVSLELSHVRNVLYTSDDFGTIPSAIGLGQRLLPSHAGLVTSLLMGVGWMFGAYSRPFSSQLLGVSSLEQVNVLTGADFDRVFLGFAVLLALSGLLALAMPGRAIRDAALTR